MLLRLSFLKVLEAGDVAELLYEVFFLGHALDHHLVAGLAGLSLVLHGIGIPRCSRVELVVVPVIPSGAAHPYLFLVAQPPRVIAWHEAGAVVVFLWVQLAVAAIAPWDRHTRFPARECRVSVADAVGHGVVCALAAGSEFLLMLPLQLLLVLLRCVGDWVWWRAIHHASFGSIAHGSMLLRC